MNLNRLRERSRFRKYEADYVAARGGLCFIQGDQSIANQAGAAFRSDLNNELQALVTNSQGATVPGTTYRNMTWHDTTLNLKRRRNAANTGWINEGTLDESFVLSRSSNTILGQSDVGKSINATAAFTQTLTAAATLADGWWCAYNAGGFAVVLDPNGAETIDGAATKTVTGSGLIYCNGSAFFTVGFPVIPAGITLGTAQASTSGTSIDFTGIPSTAKRITINFSGVSTNGTSVPIVQLGDSGGVETSGYLGAAFDNGTSFNYTTGIGMIGQTAACVRHGSIVLTLLNASTNTWAAAGSFGRSDAAAAGCSGAIKATSATLDRVRITTVGGTDAFDAGEINITYE